MCIIFVMFFERLMKVAHPMRLDLLSPLVPMDRHVDVGASRYPGVNVVRIQSYHMLLLVGGQTDVLLRKQNFLGDTFSFIISRNLRASCSTTLIVNQRELPRIELLLGGNASFAVLTDGVLVRAFVQLKHVGGTCAISALAVVNSDICDE